MDGLLAILALGTTSTKMYKLYQQNKESNSGTSSAASSLSCNYYCRERKTLSNPPFHCQPPWNLRYQHVPGTDLFFMGRCTYDHFSLSYYNWKIESYSNCEIDFATSPSFYYYNRKKKSYRSCRPYFESFLLFKNMEDVIFTPNLFPVN